MATLDDLRRKIRELTDVPKQGLDFEDLSPIFADPDCLRSTVDLLAAWARPRRPEIVLGAGTRGFILGGALAYKLGAGFIAPRSASMPPPEPAGSELGLEDGSAEPEPLPELIPAGARVLVHDDLLATGATAQAKVELVEQLGGTVVGVLFVVEIGLLQGRRRLAGHEVHSLIQL